jgi:hypothetical protein
MAKAPTKKYKLIKGIHYVPRPDHNAENDSPEDSHVVAKVGDYVDLTDAQFASLSDKFIPIDNDATEVRDANNAKLADAKIAAAISGQDIDPNKPIAPQTKKG